jgi:hypothetical protein
MSLENDPEKGIGNAGKDSLPYSKFAHEHPCDDRKPKDAWRAASGKDAITRRDLVWPARDTGRKLHNVHVYARKACMHGMRAKPFRYQRWIGWRQPSSDSGVEEFIGGTPIEQ